MLQAWTIIIVLLSYQNKSCNWKLTSQIEIKSNFPNYVLIGATKHTNSINSQSVWTKSCVIETFYALSCLNTLSEIQSYVCNSQIASYLIVFVLPIACFIKGKSASSDECAIKMHELQSRVWSISIITSHESKITDFFLCAYSSIEIERHRAILKLN